MDQNKGMWYSALTGAMTSFNFGINLTLHDITKKAYTQTKESGFIMEESTFEYFISIFALGAIIANFATPFVKINKKQFLILIDGLFFLGVLLICFARSSWHLFLGRMIQGFGFGFIGNSVPVYLSSVASLDKKGMIGGLHQLFIVTGVLSGQILGLLFEHKHFRTPYYIYMALLLCHMGALTLVNSAVSQEGRPSKSVMELISSSEAKKSLFLAIFLHVTQQLSCINGIVFFSNDVQTDPGKARQNTLLGGGVLFVSTILTMFFVEKFGRKPMLLLSILLDCACLFGVALTKYVLPFLMLFFVGFSFGLGPIVWSISAEIFPEDYLNAGLQIAVNFNWVLTFLVPLMFKKMWRGMGQKSFYFFAFYLLFSFAMTFIFLKETKGRKPGFQ